MNELILCHALIGALFGADQLLKRKAQAMEKGKVKELPLGLRFTRSFNRGAAMNLGQEVPVHGAGGHISGQPLGPYGKGYARPYGAVRDPG